MKCELRIQSLRPCRIRLEMIVGIRVFLFCSFIYGTTCTRAYIRFKYGIPARCLCSSSGDLASQESQIKCHPEDCILNTLCACSTVSQIARHTMEYDTFPATCFTPSGVFNPAPDIVWTCLNKSTSLLLWISVWLTFRHNTC